MGPQSDEQRLLGILGKSSILIISGQNGEVSARLALSLLGMHRTNGGMGVLIDTAAIGTVRDLPASGEYQTPVMRELLSLTLESRTPDALERGLGQLERQYLVVILGVEEIPGWEGVIERFSRERELKFVVTRSAQSPLPAKISSWLRSGFAVEKKAAGEK